MLLWRPVASYPYNSHRFKGPEPALPKPAGTFRIMTYGDSNTDGPDEGGWPARLQAVLNQVGGPLGLRFEVLNAGVTGYSSYQGLRQLRSCAVPLQAFVLIRLLSAPLAYCSFIKCVSLT